MNRIFAAALEIQRFCRDRAWPFCIIGGVAVGRWGEPRLTQDVDVSLLTGWGSEQPIVDELLSGFAPRHESWIWAIGREVTFVDVPPPAFGAVLGAVGVPPWQVDGLIEDYAHYARGEAAIVTPTVRDVTGAEPRDVTRFAADYARAFGGD